VHHTFDPSLLLRLAGHRAYVLGLLCQALGFVLAFLARRDLPLFLVQAGVAAGLGVTALLGVLVPKWSLPAAEVVLLALLLGGITALVLAAQPAHSRPLGTAGVLALGIAIAVIAVSRLLRGTPARRDRFGAARFAGRARGARRDRRSAAARRPHPSGAGMAGGKSASW
jgi:hypothetical protein